LISNNGVRQLQITDPDECNNTAKPLVTALIKLKTIQCYAAILMEGNSKLCLPVLGLTGKTSTQL